MYEEEDLSSCPICGEPMDDRTYACETADRERWGPRKEGCWDLGLEGRCLVCGRDAEGHPPNSLLCEACWRLSGPPPDGTATQTEFLRALKAAQELWRPWTPRELTQLLREEWE